METMDLNEALRQAEIMRNVNLVVGAAMLLLVLLTIYSAISGKGIKYILLWFVGGLVVPAIIFAIFNVLWVRSVPPLLAAIINSPFFGSGLFLFSLILGLIGVRVQFRKAEEKLNDNLDTNAID